MINQVKNNIKSFIVAAQSGDISAKQKVLQFIYPHLKRNCKDNDTLQNTVLRINTYLNSFDVEKGNFIHWSSVLLKNEKRRSFLKEQNNPEKCFSYFSHDAALFFENINQTTQKEFEFDTIDKIDLSKAVAQIVEELSPAQKQVFKLYVYESLLHTEIAQILGTHEGTSKSNLNRARITIKKKLKERYNYE